MILEATCRGCSCLTCEINGNLDKSCLQTEVLQIINGCMACYLCMIGNYNSYGNDKICKR